MRYYSYSKTNLYYEEGWFILENGLGRCSVISEETARSVEVQPLLSAAMQAINRGGAPSEWAFESNGIKIVEEKGVVRYRKSSYALDEVIRTATPIEIKGCFTVPEKVGEHTIDMVCNEAFMGCDELEEVILPETVTFIGDRAFEDCSALRRINMPKGLKRIGMRAFGETQLEKDQDPADPVFMIDHALISFSPSIQGEYVVPEHIAMIADYAFAHCQALTRLVIPDPVHFIGKQAFFNCTALEEIRFPKEVKEFEPNFDNCCSLKEVVLPEGVASIRPYAFNGCDKLKKITLPHSIQEVDPRAFYGCLPVEVICLGNKTLDELTSAKPVKHPSPEPVEQPSSAPAVQDKDAKKSVIRPILAVVCVALIILGIILIRMDGKARNQRSVGYEPYHAGIEAGAYVEFTVSSCEQIVKTELDPMGMDTDVHVTFTYVLCVDEEGDAVILLVEDLHDQSEGERLKERLTQLPCTLKGKVIEAKHPSQILMEGEEEAFARVREASMFVSPYLEEAPDTVDRMYHTDSAGRCVLTVCMMLALCLLAGWIKRSRAV